MKIKLLLVVVLLLGSKVFSQNYNFGKVSKEELSEKVYPTDSSANAAILYRSERTYFEFTEDKGFFVKTEVHERIKLYNKDGFNWATKSINIYRSGSSKEKITGLKAYTYNLDGKKVVKTKLNKSEVFSENASDYLIREKFTMPNLKPGSVIEYKYTKSSPFKRDIDRFRFQEKIPIKKVALNFKSPEYYVYKAHRRGWVLYDIKKETRDRTVNYTYKSIGRKSFNSYGNSLNTNKGQYKFKEHTYSIDLSNVAAVKEEAYSGNLDNYMASVKFELERTDFKNGNIKNYARTWEEVSKSIYKSSNFGEQLKLNKYFKDDINKLIEGVSDPMKKVALIYAFVKQKMNWNKYNTYASNKGLKKAYKDGVGNVGDINLLLTAILQYAQINANPILISTKNNGIPLFPNINGFNYVIAGVEGPNGVLLLDASDAYGAPNVLKQSLLNWKGRIIRKEGSSAWVDLFPPKPSLYNAMANVEISDEGTLIGKINSRSTNHYARSTRIELSKTTQDDRVKLIENDYDDIEISELELKNTDNYNKPLAISYAFENFDAVEELAGKLYLSPLIHFTSKDNPFKSEERKYPVDFSFPRDNRYIINISIPDGYKIETLPKSVNLSLPNNLGKFRYNISQTNNMVRLSSQIIINQSLILANHYSALKEFYMTMIAKQAEKIVLTKI